MPALPPPNARRCGKLAADHGAAAYPAGDDSADNVFSADNGARPDSATAAANRAAGFIAAVRRSARCCRLAAG